MTENHNYFETLISEIEGAEIGNLFGKPCGKITKKTFVAFFEDAMVFKVGALEVNDLLAIYEGSKKWDPSGKKRPMKDWIQVPGTYKADWKKLIAKAKTFMFE